MTGSLDVRFGQWNPSRSDICHIEEKSLEPLNVAEPSCSFPYATITEATEDILALKMRWCTGQNHSYSRTAGDICMWTRNTFITANCWDLGVIWLAPSYSEEAGWPITLQWTYMWYIQRMTGMAWPTHPLRTRAPGSRSFAISKEPWIHNYKRTNDTQLYKYVVPAASHRNLGLAWHSRHGHAPHSPYLQLEFNRPKEDSGLIIWNTQATP